MAPIPGSQRRMGATPSSWPPRGQVVAAAVAVDSVRLLPHLQAQALRLVLQVQPVPQLALRRPLRAEPLGRQVLLPVPPGLPEPAQVVEACLRRGPPARPALPAPPSNWSSCWRSPVRK